MRTSVLAALAAAGLVVAGAAHADQKHADRHHAERVSAPQLIADVLNAGGGTVTGTVSELGAHWLTINDGSGQVAVSVKNFLPEGIRKDDPVTVIGRSRHGKLEARQIILADGTSYGRGADDERGRHQDRDDD